jgi:hypothetical protein
MTTQREIQKEVLKIVDDLLEGRITPEDALLQSKKMKHVGPCDDPPSALTTILLGIEGDPCVKFPETENWREELLEAREVLKRGVPCPSDEERKTMDFFMLAYTPGGKVVFCQIRKNEKGERVLEFMEETWEGERIFDHQVPVPLIEETGPSLSEEEVDEKMSAYRNKHLTREEALQWVIRQFQRRVSYWVHADLFRFYRILLRQDNYFIADHVRYGEGDYIDKW